MDPVQNVLNFYVLCNKLKDVIRTGWKDWHVNRSRVESIAEHIYSTQMLAIAMHSEFNYDLNIAKVIFMLAVHELEEIIIGDLTQFQISKEEKQKLGHEAVSNILKPLKNGEEIKALILEFDERESKEAKFAYFCDKLDADLQCKLYDEEHCVDVDMEKDARNIHNERVQQLFDEGRSWSDLWMTFGEEKYSYDENFMKVSMFAKNNEIKLNKGEDVSD